ncbi:MAG: SDR family oxidoreductase [Candidatus Binatia bacterium]
MTQTRNHLLSTPLILLTGATGYVGGRLLKVLEAERRLVRCLARRPEFLRSTATTETEVVQGDVLAPDTLLSALEGVHTAYYLVHSMGSSGAFEEEDRRAARNFAEAAHRTGVRRIIYLGGLAHQSDTLSPHLRSRHEVGELLQESGVPVIEFRASIVIGSGSLSFEMLRALVERLPIMITPRWVSVLAQPIAIDDLLAYLLAALDLPIQENRIFEIGGAEQVSYGDLMREYARQRGLPRLMIRVPVLTPRLSSLWLGLVTPLYARVGRKIVDSIRHPTIVHDTMALHAFPIRPMGMREAIARALRNEDSDFAQTRWSDALSSGGPAASWGGVRFGSRIVDSRVVQLPVPPPVAFAPIRRIGGTTGWYYADWLWRLRGLLDLLFGGVGVRRGRRDPERLRVGETVDWWRVEAFEPDRRLRLWAEMKLPGRAWLEFEVEGDTYSSTIRQTAIFDPVGLSGLAYWYLVYPLHQLIFAGMLRGIAGEAVRRKTNAAER